MKNPINGKWILSYDEKTFILIETFIVEDINELSEKQKSKLPKDRHYELSDYHTFSFVKDNLNYAMSDSFPQDLYIKQN
jgi:hypothetical protein